jgi:hypothetical protein
MRRHLTVLLLASLGVLGALAPSASGAANPDAAPCHALFVSTALPGSVGPMISANARVDRPFGQLVVSVFAQARPPCPE